MNKKKHLIFSLLILIIFIAMFIPKPETDPSKNIYIPEPESTISEFDIQVIDPYDSLLHSLIRDKKLIGLASAIVVGNRVEFLNSYGVQNTNTNAKVNDSTLFRLASLSKGFTGILAGILNAEKTVLLEDKVVKYIPEFKLKDSVNTQNLSITNILSHTSGITPHAYDNLVEAKKPLSEIISRLHEVNVSAVPGEIYGYQNVIFSLYDSIAKIATHKPFCDLMEEKIFNPLNMPYAFAGKPQPEDMTNFAMPHKKLKKGFKSSQFNQNYYNVNPAAGVNASIADMSKWLLALLGNNPTVLGADVLDSVLKPRIVTYLPRRYFFQWGKIKTKEYAIGWRVIKYKHKKIIHHGGYVDGYKAEIAFCPEDKIGIVFLTNSPAKEANGCVPYFWELFDNYKNKKEMVAKGNIPSNPKSRN